MMLGSAFFVSQSSFFTILIRQLFDKMNICLYNFSKQTRGIDEFAVYAYDGGVLLGFVYGVFGKVGRM
jgi:hypothetical protein